jgi:hypothetical protein
MLAISIVNRVSVARMHRRLEALREKAAAQSS